MKFANIRELQKEASGLVNLVEKGEDVIITKRGKPAAVLYPLTEDDIEEYMLQFSPSIKKKIEEGLKDARAGHVTAIGELLKKGRTRQRARAKA